MKFWMNLLLFQVGWFACVLGAASGRPWLGPVFTLVWMSLHLKLLSDLRRAEMRLLVAAGVLGWISDSLLLSTGWVEFPAFVQLGLWSPVWMVALWVNLAATLRGAMSWLRGRFLLAAILGAVAGPMAYWSGSRLGAMDLVNQPAALAAIAVEWCLAMPLLLVFEKWSLLDPPVLSSAEPDVPERNQ